MKEKRVLSRELKAIIATRKKVEEEIRKENEVHPWTIKNCPLCKLGRNPRERDCGGCIFDKWEHDDFGCVNFFEKYITDLHFVQDTPIEDILSLLISLEDCYRRIDK